MKKAQALLFALFFLLMVGMTVGALALMWKSEVYSRGAEKDRLVAFYLAQAGIENGKALTCTAGSSLQWYPCADDNNPACWYRDLAGGWYKFYAGRWGIGPPTIPIQAKGRAVDSSGSVLAERQISVSVDVGTCALQQDTWQEN